MSVKEQSDKAAKQRTPRWIIILCIAIVAVPIFYVLYRNALNNRVKAKLNSIRKAGYPTTVAELQQWYGEPPSGENAADVSFEALRYFVEPWDKYDQLPFFNGVKLPSDHSPLTQEMKRQIADFLNENERILEDLRQSEPVNDRNPSFYYVRKGGGLCYYAMAVHRRASLLCLQALLYGENGNQAQATEALRRSLRVANWWWADLEPCYYVRRGLAKSLAVCTLEHLLHKIHFSYEQLAQLSRSLTAAEELQGMARSLASDTCHASDEFAGTIHTGWLKPRGSKSNGLVFILYNGSGLRDHDHLSFLQTRIEQIDALQRPFPERLRAVQTVQDRIGKQWQKQ